MNVVMMDARVIPAPMAHIVMEEAAKRFLKAPEIFMAPLLMPALGYWIQGGIPEASKSFSTFNNTNYDCVGSTKITALGLCKRIIQMHGNRQDAKFYQSDMAESFALQLEKVTGFAAKAIFKKDKNSQAEDIMSRTRALDNVISRGMAHVDLDTAIEILRWKEA